MDHRVDQEPTHQPLELFRGEGPEFGVATDDVNTVIDGVIRSFQHWATAFISLIRKSVGVEGSSSREMPFTLRETEECAGSSHEDAKEIIYRKFFDALKEKGLLFIGSTEQVMDYKDIGFTRKNSFFYQKGQ